MCKTPKVSILLNPTSRFSFSLANTISSEMFELNIAFLVRMMQKGKIRSRRLFLFNDILLVAKDKRISSFGSPDKGSPMRYSFKFQV